MEKMIVPLIEFNKQNSNGRVYVKNEITHIPDTLYCVFDHEDSFGETMLVPALTDSFATGKPVIRQDGLYLDNVFYPNQEKKQTAETLMKAGFRLVTAGTGTIEDGIVKDYRLHYAFLTKEPSWH